MTGARMLAAAAALAAACAALAGCTPVPGGPPVVVLFPGTEDDLWGASAEVLRDELAGDGYEVGVRFAGDDIPEQLAQLRSALEADAAAVVIAPIDVTSIAVELGRVDAADTAIISYDRLVLDAPEVDYFATFDHAEAGRMQARALLEALADSGAVAPLAIELLAGSGDEPAAREAFAGAMEVLGPELAAGRITVPSERTSLEQAAVLRGDPDVAARRVVELLEEGVDLAGVLSPSDTMSAAIAASLGEDERPLVLTGGGSSDLGLDAVADGVQSSTVYEDPRALARTVADMLREVVRGDASLALDATTDNGAREVPTRLLPPQLAATPEAAAQLRRGDG